MVRATSVFTPTDIPTITYVERMTRNYEQELRQAFTIPKMIVSISGPSKSGKTVLVSKVVTKDNLIHIYGATIKTAADLWINVLAWMGGSTEITETSGSKIAGGINVTAGGKIGIPLVAQGKADVQGNASLESNANVAKKAALSNLDQVVKDIAGCPYRKLNLVGN
jgi:hypothetical protein